MQNFVAFSEHMNFNKDKQMDFFKSKQLAHSFFFVHFFVISQSTPIMITLHNLQKIENLSKNRFPKSNRFFFVILLNMQKPQCFSVYFLKNLSWFDLLGIGALSAIYSDFHDEWSKFCRRMVFCFQNCSDLLNEKKCSSDREKLLKFEA